MKIKFLLFLIFISIQLFSQSSSLPILENKFSTYYYQKLSLYKSFTNKPNPIIFLGNSITEGGQWTELFDDLNVLNRGISGDNTFGILNRIEEIYLRKPSKIFLLIGINDIADGLPVEMLLKNILKISNIIHEQTPSTKMYIQSILPVNPNFKHFNKHTSKHFEIEKINQLLSDSAYSNNYEFINISDAFKDNDGHLNVNYTNDGLHLIAAGYQKWKDLIYDKVYD